MRLDQRPVPEGAALHLDGVPRLEVRKQQAQALDHAFVSDAAREEATLEILHLNAGRLSSASDHDPMVTLSP